MKEKHFQILAVIIELTLLGLIYFEVQHQKAIYCVSVGSTIACKVGHEMPTIEQFYGQ
jgi:hypothetical protein